jgi:hypothetical protein
MPPRYIKKINHLSKKQFNELGKYLKSPCINSNRKLVRLYNFIRKYRSAFLYEQFSNEDIYKKLYAGRSYKKKTIYNLNSRMNKVIERYLLCSRCPKLHTSPPAIQRSFRRENME